MDYFKRVSYKFLKQKIEMIKLLTRAHLFLANCKGIMYSNLRYYVYRTLIPFKAWRIRHKDTIRILFVVSEISMWKTENLYIKMSQNHRINPMLLACPNCVNSDSDIKVINYFKEKGYCYFNFTDIVSIEKDIFPDIIFYQQAYPGYISDELFESYNRKSLFCFVNYCFRNTITPSTINLRLLNIAWKVFSENESVSKEIAPLMKNKGSNLVNTGLPIMDELIKVKEFFPDRWMPSKRTNKRIIYAPHHSILPDDKLSWGSIVEYGDFILHLAKKYSDTTQWVFKPHPFLKEKLKKIWGDEKTTSYYQQWELMENSQIVEGDYLDIFKHSDALIHDCGSFLIEYHYTLNPALYLFSHRPQHDIDISKLSILARDLHYHANKYSDIESFILNVISEIDPLREKREWFYYENLKPKGKSACDSIINEILGKHE